MVCAPAVPQLPAVPAHLTLLSVLCCSLCPSAPVTSQRASIGKTRVGLPFPPYSPKMAQGSVPMTAHDSFRSGLPTLCPQAWLQ